LPNARIMIHQPLGGAQGERDNFMSSAEAVKYGLIDEVIEKSK